MNERELVCRGVYVLTRGLHDREAPDASACLSERLQQLGVEPAGPLKRYAERGLSLYEPLSVDRGLLVGEAGGIDPVLGEGIPQAILYGRMAGGYIAQAWRKRDFRFQDYRRVMRKARVGFDLRIRTAALGLIYGRTRPKMERVLTRSRALADAGMHYFAGERVPRPLLLRAAVDLLIA